MEKGGWKYLGSSGVSNMVIRFEGEEKLNKEKGKCDREMDGEVEGQVQ